MRRTALAVVIVSAMLAPLSCTKAKANKESFCRELRRTASLSEVLSGLQSDDPSTVGRKAREADAQFTKLERAAPRDIRSDVSEVASLVSKIAKAVERSPSDPEAAANTLRGEGLESLGAGAAALRLIAYSRNTCHYDLGEPPGSAPDTSTPGTTVPVTPTT